MTKSTKLSRVERKLLSLSNVKVIRELGFSPKPTKTKKYKPKELGADGLNCKQRRTAKRLAEGKRPPAHVRVLIELRANKKSNEKK